MTEIPEKETSIVFDQERAASYDRRMAKFAPVRDNLHLLMRMILAGLPDHARVLCVGAGSGEELMALATAYPGWCFTAVEPAAAMLARCQQRAAEQGVSNRVYFHEGYLDTLPSSEPFDSATSILVSHFILQSAKRRAYFSDIADRMRPGAILVTADIASDMNSSEYKQLMEVWMRMQQYAGMTDEELENHRQAFGEDVAVLPVADTESLISSSGFESPVLFFQSLLIHGWMARRQVD